jgi:hypothetical protein
MEPKWRSLEHRLLPGDFSKRSTGLSKDWEFQANFRNPATGNSENLSPLTLGDHQPCLLG